MRATRTPSRNIEPRPHRKSLTTNASLTHRSTETTVSGQALANIVKAFVGAGILNRGNFMIQAVSTGSYSLTADVLTVTIRNSPVRTLRYRVNVQDQDTLLLPLDVNPNFHPPTLRRAGNYRKHRDRPDY